jgi:prophage tail gpP-like protein
MKLEVNGNLYSGFLSATATISIDSLSNKFSFTSAPDVNSALPFSRGDECIVRIDGEAILTGYIEVISGNGDIGTHSIHILGRDRTSDLVDSSLLPIKDITPPITFKRIIEIVIQSIGSSLDVIDLTNSVFDKAEDLISIEAGDNAFDFIERLARKKNVIITSNSDGDVVIQNSIGKLSNADILNVIGNPNNNVVSYQFNYDDTGRFNRYEVVGQQNINVLSNLGSSSKKKVINERGRITDELIREGRQFVLTSENPGSGKMMGKRANWELNVRRARSRTYKAVVVGYKNQLGEIWTTNMLVHILDQHAKIDDIMLVNEVTYRLDSSGSTTELAFVNRDAYIAEPEFELPKKDSAESAFIVPPVPKSYLDKYR